MNASEHAILYLIDTQKEMDTTAATCYSAFKHVTGKVTVPCRAIGVARDALYLEGWNVQNAIQYLKDKR